jgi:hypothetical protein
MPFQRSDAHIEEYRTHGYTVFRGIVPPALIADLRREADRGRAQVRERQGPQAQRFQPVAKSDLDLRPFQDFRELPELREAVSAVLSPRHTYGNVDLMGVLIEPGDLPWCTQWHRDWRDNVPYLDLREWEAVFHNADYFNQCNCALYEDHSLWVVPGSHLRSDLAGEAARFPERPVPGPDLQGKTSEERERTALEYARSMPGAVQLHLEAGDYALYRNTLWHLGNYVPYARRATLHDFVDTPEFSAWRARMGTEMAARKEAGHPAWEWNRGKDGG